MIMNKKVTSRIIKNSDFLVRLFAIVSILLLSSCALLTNQAYIKHEFRGDSLVITSNAGVLKLNAFEGGAIEVLHIRKGEQEFPSYAKKEGLDSIGAKYFDSENNIRFKNGALTAVIQKSDLSIDFYRGGKILARQKKLKPTQKKAGFDFELEESEKIMGGGSRVLGMDRRGHRLPLYNRAHYGYNTHSNQMSFSIPAIMSDKKYLILFDNSSSGFLDIAHTEKNTLSFESVGGRNAYVLFAASSYPKLINNYVDVTGKQPLPPRWAFGNFASRFGYRSQQQVIDTVNKFKQENIPLDSIIIDLYWFGKDIKGHMGNLDWDKKHFPTPLKMIGDLQKENIKTILVTEPFILSSSSKWQQAVDNNFLTKDHHGAPKRFDFYFGNTGLIDIFDDKAQDWFSSIYTDLAKQGVAGVWGDLGEPEVHPDDSIHFISETNTKVTGDLIHNVYGHQWAKMVYKNQIKNQPDNRPFIMMRSGFAGSQRYGMIPWTGDVDRSWLGLKPQVELSLQMGLLGMGYTHSDLGGFAGGEKFDKEMYIRWLQYGVFQPIYRPHAQDHIAPEPVFHDQQTKDILRDFIKLRYRMLPYNYTAAYQNSTTGMPMMRPVFFENEKDSTLIDVKDTYLWGDAFLISPVTEPNKKLQNVNLPKGVWFDFWNDKRYEGNKTVSVPVNLETLPVMVRAGSFVPMIEEINNTHDYKSDKLILHYYADETILNSKGLMYEDDGESRLSLENKEFELLRFSAQQKKSELNIKFSKSGNGYKGAPSNRKIEMVIHNWKNKPQMIKWGNKLVEQSRYRHDQKTKRLNISVSWEYADSELTIM